MPFAKVAVELAEVQDRSPSSRLLLSEAVPGIEAFSSELIQYTLHSPDGTKFLEPEWWSIHSECPQSGARIFAGMKDLIGVLSKQQLMIKGMEEGARPNSVCSHGWLGGTGGPDCTSQKGRERCEMASAHARSGRGLLLMKSFQNAAPG